MKFMVRNPFKFWSSKNPDIPLNPNILLTQDKIYPNYMEDGNDIKWEDTVEFTFPITGGRVIKVYDADTITIASKLPYDQSPMYRLSVRLNGIDTPEIKGKGISDEEKESAKLARDYVSNLALNKFVRLENIQSEKYGRILADVYIGDIYLNELLVKERYAVKYDGGTRFSKIKLPVHDEYLYFTDGLSSLSSNVLPLTKKPVYTITSLPSSDYAFLNYNAIKTGGNFINLNQLKVEDALDKLVNQSLKFLGVKENYMVTDLYPMVGTPVSGSFSVAGISLKEQNQVVLLFGY
jgi:endonuclease YncB( thermonuclease family)